MAGAWIENEVNAALTKPVTRPVVFAPCIFADLKTETYSVHLVDNIANTNTFISTNNFSNDVCGPGVEPTRFIVYAIAGKVLFQGYAQYLLVMNYTRSVVGYTFNPYR